MKLVLIADTFPPARTSGAVQLRDLCRELARQSHNVTVLLPCAEQREPWQLEDLDGVRVLRLKAPPTKNLGYFRRTLSEMAMPFWMLRNLGKSPLANEKWDGLIWYAPSIFHGPLIKAVKNTSHCKGYLIIRDIFPEWAVDVGLMGRGLTYRFFDAVARYQYSAADVIGIQTPGNQKYFNRWLERPNRKLEVLQNWLDVPRQTHCSIRLDETILADRKVLVYAGNMGVAQGLDIFLELAEKMRARKDVGFLFVGRGSDAIRLKATAQTQKLDNVVFFDEIPVEEIPDLYAQCKAGIVALHHSHKSHNIPGKFLTYMQCGLPVLANVNAGNDLAGMIRDGRVGQVGERNLVEELMTLSEYLLAQIENDPGLPNRCRELFSNTFTVEKTVQQIVAALLSPHVAAP